VTIKDGHLYRNGLPFLTQRESTFHSGKGTVIFVMDCYGNIYAGSHGGVFFHSSFMADGPVILAGELKTDSQGKIIFVSNKSGHYAPGVDAVVSMLNYFSSHGVNRSEVSFAELFSGSEKVFANAQEFLEQLKEKVEVAN
jgi:hypothetical protein